MKKRYSMAVLALCMAARCLFAAGPQQRNNSDRSSKAVISYGTGQAPATIHINGNTTGHTIAPGETRELNVAEGRVTVEVVSGTNDTASVAFNAEENITRINFDTVSRPVQSNVMVTYADGKKIASVSVYVNGVREHTLTGLGDSVTIPVDEGRNTIEIRSRRYSESIRFTADSNDTWVQFDISKVLRKITRLEITKQTKKAASIITGLAIAGTEALPPRPAPAPPPAVTASPAQPSPPTPASPPQAASYYVSAAGNDENDGLSETAAFKTLSHAVVTAGISETIKRVTVIGTLNQASEGDDGDAVFRITNMNDTTLILITGIPGASSGRRAVLSASATQKNGVDMLGGIGSVRAYRFEHIEISGSVKTGLQVSLDVDVTLGPGSVVRNNQGGGVDVFAPRDEYKGSFKSGSLTLDGGIVENNKRENSGGGIHVLGAFTMKRGSVRNNAVVPDKDGVAVGGGIYIRSSDPVSIEGGNITGNTALVGGGVLIMEGRVTMAGGTVSGNTATRSVGGVGVYRGAAFNQRGGTISGNRAPSSTPANTHNLYRMPN